MIFGFGQNPLLFQFQADLLSLEDIVGSGRLPTHIFLLDSLSLLRNQVLPNLDNYWFI